MSYAILGAGRVGQALATAFARKGIEVAIASRRPVETLAPVAKAIGPTVVPKTMQDAVKAEKGSGEPNKNKIGKVTMAQCKAIAKEKIKDLNAFD